MSQLTDNLNTIASIKGDIRDAIQAKGVNMSGVAFSGYASKIGEIPTGGGQKPEETLVESITSNGSYSYSPTPGSVFSSVALSVDVHPSMSLERRYGRNGYYSLTGEWKDGLIITDIHPSQSLVETITSNGTTSFSGEWKDATISVSVPTTVTVSMSQSAYNDLSVKDSNTIYLING